jgi:Flp pilus assembly protein TadG
MKSEGQKMRWKCYRKKRDGEGGQSLVETALVVPVLVTLLVGAVEMGRVAYASIAVANAAKAGAQYGCENGYTAQDTSGIALAASDEAPTLTVSTTSSSACACSDGSASTCLNTDCANSHIEQTLTVNTSATVSANIRLPGLPNSYTVKGQSIQRVVQ